MPVEKDPSGQRSVHAEAEVPGTPEEVWRAIATGPGMSAWFVPSTCEERAGGVVTNNFGPGMESVAALKTWNPPHSFSAETEEEPGKIATEWTVEAKDGGTCVVRVVHRWFSSSDEWDAQFEGHTHGWRSFFRILRLYLQHYSGQPSSAFPLAGFSPLPAPEVWQKLTTALGIRSGSTQVSPVPGAPPLAAVIEHAGPESHPELLLRLSEPAPGLAHLFVMPIGGQVMISFRFYLYGEQAAAIVPLTELKWNEWLAQLFPSVSPESMHMA